MAPRMRLWLGLALAGMALISVWALPLRPRDEWIYNRYGYSRDLTPEEEAFRRVRAQVRELGGAYQRLAWGDSLEALAVAASEGGSGFLARVPSLAGAGPQVQLEEGIEAQLRASGITLPTMPVGSVVMGYEVGLHPGIREGIAWSSDWELFVSRDPQKPHCFLVDPELSRDPRINRALDRMLWTGPDSTLAPNPLGPCLLHAKYGSPGEGMFRWLRAGGYALAEGSMGTWNWSRRRYLPAYDISRVVFLGWFGSGLSQDGLACAGGKEESCLRALPGMAKGGTPTVVLPWPLGEIGFSEPEDFPLAYSGRGSLSRFGRAGARLLYDLEEEFGPERFARFWKSDQDVETAFEAAFGKPIEDWLMGWLQARWGVPEVGAGVPLQASLLSFLTVGLFAGLALYMGRRKS